MSALPGRFFTPRVNLSLYSLLLIITPFLMLQNYLQDAIGMLSAWSYSIGGKDIPFVLTAFILFILFLFYRFRRSLTLKNLAVWIIIFSMWLIGQKTSDYYLNMPFYQLQHNWHYFAYGIFSFLAYQVFSTRFSNPAKIIIRIYLMAMAISTFDEMMQVFISSRIFDISDIAKDLWGVLMGSIYIFFIYIDHGFLKRRWKIREKRVRDYLNNPQAILVLLMIYTYILLFVSSTLTEVEYAFHVVFISVSLFLLVFFVIHASRTKAGKIVFSLIFSILIILLVHSVIRNWDKGITHNKPGITVYKGIPIPFFDIMIFENGWFRLVDKKVSFNQGDKRFFYEKASNILIIGCGEERKSRMGFPEDLESQFVFNNISNRGLQVIILPTEEACKVFNRLKKEEKQVLFIIHNTR